MIIAQFFLEFLD